MVKDHEICTVLKSAIASNGGSTAGLDISTLLSGHDINSPNEEGDSALIDAACDGETALVTLLLSHPNININHRSNNNVTALIRAAEFNNLEVLRVLLSQPRVRISTRDGDGYTAVKLAEEMGYKECVGLLEKTASRHVIYKTLMVLARQNDLEAVKKLMKEHGIDTNQQDVHGNSALMNAINGSGDDKGKPEMANWLFGREDININLQNDKGFTPLMLAFHHDNAEVTKTLLEREEINVNLQNVHGHSALIWVAEHNKCAAVKMLLERSDIDTKLVTSGGLTAVESARKQGHSGVVDILEKHG